MNPPTTVSASTDPGPDTNPTSRWTSRDQPQLHDLVRVVACTYLEIEAGCRPLAQLAPALTPILCRRLERRLRPGRPGPAVDALVSIRTCRPTRDRLDAAVITAHAPSRSWRRNDRTGRLGVLVVSLERYQNTWRVTELARPEHTCRGAGGRTVRQS